MSRYMIGIDEVGRGPLAGPVVAAAVAIPSKLKLTMSDIVRLRDSKKLTPKQRHIWFDYIKKHPRISFAAAKVCEKTIDKINIANAANLAATRALRRLFSHPAIAERLSKEPKRAIRIMLDGGLHLNLKELTPRPYTLNPKTVIKGDEKINAIKLASIVAKVKRDKLMERFHKKYPSYGFNQHKGYGTKAHFAAIRRLGVCPHHRLTFLKKYLTINPNTNP